jgi:hypothetical protein
MLSTLMRSFTPPPHEAWQILARFRFDLEQYGLAAWHNAGEWQKFGADCRASEAARAGIARALKH